jgi:predicted nucleic-acid-binding protein
MPGVQLFQQTDFPVLLSLWPTRITDFGDAVIAATGKAIKGSTIVTFDPKFISALKQLGLDSHQIRN